MFQWKKEKRKNKLQHLKCLQAKGYSLFCQHSFSTALAIHCFYQHQEHPSTQHLFQETPLPVKPGADTWKLVTAEGKKKHVLFVRAFSSLPLCFKAPVHHPVIAFCTLSAPLTQFSCGHSCHEEHLEPGIEEEEIRLYRLLKQIYRICDVVRCF